MKLIAECICIVGSRSRSGPVEKGQGKEMRLQCLVLLLLQPHTCGACCWWVWLMGCMEGLQFASLFVLHVLLFSCFGQLFAGLRQFGVDMLCTHVGRKPLAFVPAWLCAMRMLGRVRFARLRGRPHPMQAGHSVHASRNDSDQKRICMLVCCCLWSPSCSCYELLS